MKTKIFTFAFLVLFLKGVLAKDSCSDYYSTPAIRLSQFLDKSTKRTSAQSLITFDANSRESQTLNIEIPPNHKGDVQIEILGEPTTIYLISSLYSDSNTVLIGKAKEKSSSKVTKDTLNLIELFPGISDVDAYNSNIRSLPGYEFTSVIIPYKWIKKFKEGLHLKLKVEADKTFDRPTKARVFIQSRKALDNYKPGKIKLDLFFPSDLKRVYSSDILDELILRLNKVYESATIQFQISSQLEISNNFKNIDIDKTPPSLEASSASEKPTLPLVFCSSLSSCSLGSIGGFSEGIPGATSYEVNQRYRVYIAPTPPPNRMDPQAMEAWLVETTNYLAHEIGHYLGLPHTYERVSNKLQDPFSDTPNQDSGNVMDPLIIRSGIPSFSFKQIDQIRAHPLVEEL